MKCLHIFFSGNVHGVGFRFTASALAPAFKIKGWVKNCYDGKVELMAEGEEADLKKFLAAVENEMCQYIHEKQVSREPATGEFKRFEIRF